MQISLTFVNEFVKWPRPLNLIGRLKLGHPGWQLFKLVAKRQQEKQMSLCKDSSVLKTYVWEDFAICYSLPYVWEDFLLSATHLRDVIVVQLVVTQSNVHIQRQVVPEYVNIQNISVTLNSYKLLHVHIICTILSRRISKVMR